MTDIAELIKNNGCINVRLNTKINNINGRYWQAMRRIIFALTDLRARVGTFTNPWSADSDPDYAVPTLAYTNEHLYDIVNNRAIELVHVAKAENKHMLVMWSGGIDSTLVVTSLLKNSTPADLDNVTIVLTLNSIIENYDFYKNHIKTNFKCISWLDIEITNELLENNIIVHGDPADCLFGPSVAMYEKLIPTGEHLLPFKDNVSLIAKIIDSKNLHITKEYNVPEFGSWYAKKITNNLLEVAPENVETIADWWWWHYFNFKWQFSLIRPLMRRRNNGAELIPLSDKNFKSYIDNSFFNTERFQQWSYSNLKTHVGSDIKNHKLLPKQYIYEYDKNIVYLNTKTKVESVPVYDQGLELKLRKPLLWTRRWTGYYEDYPGLFQQCVEKLEMYKG